MIDVVVGTANANGSPCLLVVRNVPLTDRVGTHYELAKAAAINEGYDAPTWYADAADLGAYVMDCIRALPIDSIKYRRL